MEMHRRGAIAEAAARYSQVLSFDPKNVDALCLLGMAASQQKQFAQSVELLRKAVKVAPRHAPAHNLLGAALKELGRAEEALKSFDRALSHCGPTLSPRTPTGAMRWRRWAATTPRSRASIGRWPQIRISPRSI